jgi:hypothetical protein
MAMSGGTPFRISSAVGMVCQIWVRAIGRENVPFRFRSITAPYIVFRSIAINLYEARNYGPRLN